MVSIVWFREDLRLTDHAALVAAVAESDVVVPVFVDDRRPASGLRRGAAARWWLHGSLASLDRALRERGSRLVLADGPADAALAWIASETGASTVFATPTPHHAGPDDGELARALRGAGLELRLVGSAYLVEPRVLLARRPSPYRVFSAFERAARATISSPAPLGAPVRVPAPAAWPTSMNLQDLRLRGTWDPGTWTPGEASARARLDDVLASIVGRYGLTRDIPSIDGTSRLSPHLAFGELSATETYASVAQTESRLLAVDGRDGSGESSGALSRELLWREHARHLLAAYPSMIDTSIGGRVRELPWRDAPDDFERWQHGQTGYPLVDAGMRQLAATGWMHNRVRMVTASFLIKHLLIPWQQGAAWFWESLVDADLASNAMNWQWVAGTGVDAAPYFRVFNPARQGERFDPDGAYVRRWVPELAALPPKWIHRPWSAPASVLAAARVHLGRTYPPPLVDHEAARQRFLGLVGTWGRRDIGT